MAEGSDREGTPGRKDLEHENALAQREFWRRFEVTRLRAHKALIWALFFGVLWLLRDFFALVFVTFVLSFLGASLTRWLGRRFPRMGWRLRAICVFGGALLVLTGLIFLLVPQVRQGLIQLGESVQGLPDKWEKEFDPWLREHVVLYRSLVEEDAAPGKAPPEPPASKPLWEVETVREFLLHVQQETLRRLPRAVASVATGATALFTLAFLSILFSFLIVFDLAGLQREVKKLELTKLNDFYRETARDIVRFGAVLGKVLEAQAVIAAVNAALTAAGIWLLGLPNVAFLSLLVFVCGFIPVAGVFLSSAPICLVALYVGGLSTVAIFVVFVAAIHFLEAYVLNPRIMGAALHINPVLVLVILVIGLHTLGTWGLLLGVPICYYFFTFVIKKEDVQIGLGVRYRKNA